MAMAATKRRRCAVLPDHLIEEIFLRLPPKSVLRCRCLSRAWAAALSCGDFVDRYLKVANLHGGPRIMGVEDMLPGCEPKVLSPLTITPRVIPIDSFPPLATLMPSMQDYSDEPPIHQIAAMPVTSQCRGLVVLTASHSEANMPGMSFVCNPTTGQLTALPEGRTTGRRRGSGRENYESLGLGYDVRTRKHKVVRIYYRGRLMSSSSGCEVLEINGPTATGMWRPTGEKPTGWIKGLARSAFAQGHVYWLAYRELYPQSKEMFIMSFSIGDEKLGAIQPPPLEMDDITPYDLTVLGGRLCVFASDKYKCQIWLLDQCGSGGATWDLRYRVDLAPKAMLFGASPLAIIDDGRRILLTEPSWPVQVYAYDPLTKETQNLLEWSIPNSDMGISCAAVYEESIASPGRPPREDTILISSPSTQALWLLLQLQYQPPCTIGRLMCVCRSWRSMICSLY